MKKNHIIDEIEELAAGGSDVSIFLNIIPDMDELNDEEIDIVLIKNMKALKERLCCGTLDQSWRAQSFDIASGEYPLEKLPEHVRDIAKKLFYKS